MKIRAAAPEDAPAIARVHVASWRAIYRGIVSQAFLDAIDEQLRAQMWRNAFENTPTVKIAVAETEGAVCGFASGGPLRKAISLYDAELYAIYLHPASMRQGLGRALFKFIADQLAADGMKHLLVWTLRDNPSKGFYERLGGTLVAEEPHEVGGQTLASVAYGWPEFCTTDPFQR